MRPVALLLPGRLEARTGGTVYDRRMVDGVRRRGWHVDVWELDETFPRPTPDALAEAARVLDALPGGTIALIDSLALGAMPDLVERAALRLDVVALMHLPLCADPARDRESAEALAAGEGRALAAVRRVVITGAVTERLLERYALRADLMVLIEPGTDPAPIARGSGSGPVHLLSVATLNAGKGHELLLRALADVPDDGWRLTCAGSLTRDMQTAERVRAVARDLGLADRVHFAGDLDADALDACYDTADVFVLGTSGETYGLVVAEALARGLPVVSTRTGAIEALVGDAAGLVVDVGDQAALTVALRQVITDKGLRATLAAGARAVRPALRTWEDAAEQMVKMLETLDDRE